jgi:hypothetical protein
VVARLGGVQPRHAVPSLDGEVKVKLSEFHDGPFGWVDGSLCASVLICT